MKHGHRAARELGHTAGPTGGKGRGGRTGTRRERRKLSDRCRSHVWLAKGNLLLGNNNAFDHRERQNLHKTDISCCDFNIIGTGMCSLNFRTVFLFLLQALMTSMSRIFTINEYS